jgi:hypothetical protein
MDENEDDFTLRVSHLGDALTEVARDLGLYLQRVLVPDQEMGPGSQVTILAEFMIGDVAWSDEVLHPVRHAQDMDTRLRLHEAGLNEQTAIEDARRELREALGQADD